MKRAQLFFQRFRSWWQAQSLRRKIFYVALLAVVVLIVISKVKNSTEGVIIETVKRMDLVQSVSASGSVVSTTDLSLGFEQSKVVSTVAVVVGQKVTKGTILATLSNWNERAAVSSARGALLVAQAKYKKVLEGASNEEITVARVAFENAQKELASITKVQNGLVENARRKLNSDGLVAQTAAITSSTPTISGTYTGTEGLYRLTLYPSGDGSYVSFEGIESGTARASTTTAQALGTKGLSILFSNGVGQPATWTVLIPNTTGSNYVANLNAYEAAKDARDAAIATAQSAVATAEAQLALKRATARQADIDAALAEVVTAQAGLDQATANLEQTILRAPADGTITSVDVKPGELALANKQAVALQDIGNLYLEANINESNVDLLSVGQEVVVTFDAFGASQYRATLSSIDPAATIENNVVNYKVKALISDIKDVRPGMTANMTIITKQVPNALVLPGRVIIKNEEGAIVQKIVGKRTKTTTESVTLGLRGDGDMVEILIGLSEGDRVLWSPKSK